MILQYLNLIKESTTVLAFFSVLTKSPPHKHTSLVCRRCSFCRQQSRVADASVIAGANRRGLGGVTVEPAIVAMPVGKVEGEKVEVVEVVEEVVVVGVGVVAWMEASSGDHHPRRRMSCHPAIIGSSSSSGTPGDNSTPWTGSKQDKVMGDQRFLVKVCHR